MSVAEKLDNLQIDTIIHILSLEHFNLIKNYADKETYVYNSYGHNLCLRKAGKNKYKHSYLTWYKENGYTNIITSDIICNNELIYELW